MTEAEVKEEKEEEDVKAHEKCPHAFNM